MRRHIDIFLKNTVHYTIDKDKNQEYMTPAGNPVRRGEGFCRMKAPWEHLENWKELVYVADVQTFELVYMNAAARKAFSLENYQGKTCYGVLQKLPKPCAFCTNYKLKNPGDCYEWIYRNPVLQRVMALKDTLIEHQGRLYRMEIAAETCGETLSLPDSSLVRQESFVNECLMVTHSTADPHQSLQRMLRYLVDHTGCDGAYIHEVRDGDMVYNTYSYTKDASSPQYPPLCMDFALYIQDWYQEFHHNEPMYFYNLEQMRDRVPDLYQYLLPYESIHSLVLFPLLGKGGLLGFLRLDNPPETLVSVIMENCKMLSHFIVAILQRRDLMDHLKRISYYDPLTGALNRHALSKNTDKDSLEDTVGLVYCDVVGLKKVNDTLGHEGGDRLIVQAYTILRETFPRSKIFRIGGDEFIVLRLGASKETFSERVAALRERMRAENCTLSVGSVWADRGEKDFSQLLQVADSRMYEDKRAFYRQMEAAAKGEQDTRKQDSAFQAYLKNYYFDADAGLQAIVVGEAGPYLFCGDVQKNTYYVSDNFREDFQFEDNLVYDFLPRMEEKIYEPDRRQAQREMHGMFEENRTAMAVRFRARDKDGALVWISCRAALKWDETGKKALFLAGSLTNLKNEMEVDPITGFLSLSFARHELARAGGGQPAMALSFTFQNFSDINHTFGRAIGDAILQEIAWQLEMDLGSDFRFFRLEGLRFLAVSHKADDPGPPSRRIHEVVAEVYRSHGVHMLYPCAVGLLYYPQDGQTPQEFIDNALVVAQTAKAFPELDYLSFSPHMSAICKNHADLSLALHSSINHAFENFRIVVQPQVRTDTGRIFGGEILLRWKNQGSDMPPAKFIPILEQSGLILPVGKWVITQALKACRDILRRFPDFLLSINVSYLQIVDENFFPFLQQTMQEFGIPGKNLAIELTETHFDEMPDHLEHFITQCQEMGITFALDDFGNAYSSLQLLLRYPASLIKLDRMLMCEVTSSKEKMDFIMSVIYACHRFGKQVCVEGVETAEEFAAIQKTGCDFIQGFYFYRPMELEDFFRTIDQPEESTRKGGANP